MSSDYVYRWVNRKDQGGNNVFEGGFLGLDNIGAFNRSEPLPTGGTLRQADGTAWMAFYCLNMCVPYLTPVERACPYPYTRLNMALELAKNNPVYEDIASKFFEVSHVLCVALHARHLIRDSVAFHLHFGRHDLQRRR